ncbi:DUF2393 domain-containing protein [bacterium]|nr:DUF2393 domain-containing protein [bacterium]MBU1989681.1 DUF2393 domain-containing protein [bacterium]
MKEKITAFIHNLILYDYILFGSVFVLFILFIVLSILMRKKLFFSIFLVLLSFAILTLGSTIGYIAMHQYLFKNSVALSSQKQLTFTQAVVVKGTLLNESKFDFKSCNVRASVYKVSGNPIKDYIFTFNPFQKMSMLEHNISIGETRYFKMIIEPFTYSGDYNISLGAKCR